MLGVLGGMGPMATADFLRKLVLATPATLDQDHLPTITYSATTVPDRIAAIERRGPDPLPALIDGIRRLEAAGATRIAIPCNTAHHWHRALQDATSLPILHIVDAVADVLVAEGVMGGSLGLLATTGTLRTAIYQDRLERRGFVCRSPTDQDAVTRAIALVKANRMAEATAILRPQAESLLASGCRRVVLACTEIPLALPAAIDDPDGIGALLLDATDALAQACVAACFADASRATIPA